jgi:hypothetical protein
MVSDDIAVKHGWGNSRILKATSQGLGKLTASLTYLSGHQEKKEVLPCISSLFCAFILCFFFIFLISLLFIFFPLSSICCLLISFFFFFAPFELWMGCLVLVKVICK